jgi:hypothetical protein
MRNPIFIRLNDQLEVSVASIDRIRWGINRADEAEVFITEDSQAYLVSEPYLNLLREAMSTTRLGGTSAGNYSQIKQIIRLSPEDIDLIDSFLQDGWAILEIEKSRCGTKHNFVENTTFVLGADEYACTPEAYDERHGESVELNSAAPLSTEAHPPALSSPDEDVPF